VAVTIKIFETETRRDIDVTRWRRDRDFEQKVEMRPRLECTKTRHETFKTTCLQNVTNFLTLIFGQWIL